MINHTMNLIVELAFGGDFDSAALIYQYEYVLKHVYVYSRVSLKVFISNKTNKFLNLFFFFFFQQVLSFIG